MNSEEDAAGGSIIYFDEDVALEFGAVPLIYISCLSDAGMFLEPHDIWQGRN